MTAEEIKKVLTKSMNAQEIEVVDESHLHQGHVGAQGGGGHFRVRIVSKEFDHQTMIERHRAVYKILSMPNNPQIHALALTTLTPEESSDGRGKG